MRRWTRSPPRRSCRPQRPDPGSILIRLPKNLSGSLVIMTSKLVDSCVVHAPTSTSVEASNLPASRHLTDDLVALLAARRSVLVTAAHDAADRRLVVRDRKVSLPVIEGPPHHADSGK